MAGSKLDGAGVAKLKTLEAALSQLQSIHALVERMGVAVKNRQPTTAFGQQLRRAATPLVGLLKGQFGMISDQVAAMILAATRGGNEQTRLRTMREHVATIRTALEIMVNRVQEQHTVKDEHPAGGDA